MKFIRDGFILASAQKELTWYWCLLDFSILKCYKLHIWVCWLLVFYVQIYLSNINEESQPNTAGISLPQDMSRFVDLFIRVWNLATLLCTSTSPSLCLLTALGHSFCLFHKLLSCTWLKVTFSSCNLPVSHALNYNYQYICWQFPNIYLQLMFFS